LFPISIRLGEKVDAPMRAVQLSQILRQFNRIKKTAFSTTP